MPDTQTPVARTPLHQWHAAHGARFIERHGWQVVAGYAAAAPSGFTLADVSAFAKISLRGPGVPALAQALLPDSAALHPRGVADVPGLSALACRLTDDHLLLLASSPRDSALDDQLARLREGRTVVLTDVTSTYAGFEVIGTPLEELLRRLTHLDVRPATLAVNSCAETALAGVEALLVRLERQSMPALRVYVAWDLAEYVWERMIDAGRDLSLTPVELDSAER